MTNKIGYLYEVGQLIPGTQLRVQRQVGMGGMGTVYEAQELSAGRVFVVKLLHPHLVRENGIRERLRAEAKVLASFDHESIVQVFWSGLTADKPPIPFYVMERLKGRTLARTLRRMKKKGHTLSLDRAFMIIVRLLSALDYAHKRGVIHRDVKSENIFLHETNTGEISVKLLDFGIARIVGEVRATAGGFVGTLGCAPPEQLRGEDPTPACDVYSAAMVLYEMLTGGTPFEESESQQAIISAHLFKPPALLSTYRSVPPALDELVQQMLLKDPKARPSAVAVIHSIAAIRATLPGHELESGQADADFAADLGNPSVTNTDEEEDGDWSEQTAQGNDGPDPFGLPGSPVDPPVVTEEIINPEAILRAHVKQVREAEMLVNPPAGSWEIPRASPVPPVALEHVAVATQPHGVARKAPRAYPTREPAPRLRAGQVSDRASDSDRTEEMAPPWLSDQGRPASAQPVSRTPPAAPSFHAGQHRRWTWKPIVIGASVGIVLVFAARWAVIARRAPEPTGEGAIAAAVAPRPSVAAIPSAAPANPAPSEPALAPIAPLPQQRNAVSSASLAAAPPMVASSTATPPTTAPRPARRPQSSEWVRDPGFGDESSPPPASQNSPTAAPSNRRPPGSAKSKPGSSTPERPRLIGQNALEAL